MQLTEPWRNEHRRFFFPLDAIRQSAERVGDLSLPELRKAIDAADAFLVQQFLPHARTEEEEVYPLVDRLIGGSHLTEGIVRDHAKVRQLARKLVALRERLIYSYFGPAQIHLLRGVLYEVHGLIEFHMAKEDELYLRLVDQIAVTEGSARVGAAAG